MDSWVFLDTCAPLLQRSWSSHQATSQKQTLVSIQIIVKLREDRKQILWRGWLWDRHLQWILVNRVRYFNMWSGQNLEVQIWVLSIAAHFTIVNGKGIHMRSYYLPSDPAPISNAMMHHWRSPNRKSHPISSQTRNSSPVISVGME